MSRRSKIGAGWLAVLLAGGCEPGATESGSSGSNWLRCRTLADCSAARDAVACDVEGYCVDSDDLRIPDTLAPRDAERDAGAPGEDGGEVATGLDAATSAGRDADLDAPLSVDASSAAQADADAGRADAASLQPFSECTCYSENVKRPVSLSTASRDPAQIIFKFADGARVRLISGVLGVVAEGRTAQDLAELACAGLDEAATEAGLAEMRALLSANPSVTIAANFPTPPGELDSLRSFGGRHCVAAGEPALPDLTTYYELRVPVAEGERLLRALDANPLVTSGYFGTLPVPSPGGS